MKKLLIATAAVVGLLGMATGASAQGHEILVQANDLNEPDLFIDTFIDGTLVQHAFDRGDGHSVFNESYNGGYSLTWHPNSTLASNVDVAVNILESTGAISDTWHIFGNQGDQVIQIPFFSDTETSLPPLPNAVNMVETGHFQTVAQFTLTNGDHYTWQFGSDSVPEPASWALMIGGFGLAGAALRRRRATATA